MNPLISTTDAAALIGSGAAVVLDVRWRLTGPPGREDYTRGHLPGAVFVDLDTALSAPARPAAGRHPLPDPDRLREVFRAAGIGDDTPVIVYDDADGSAAARAWWLLRWLGHREVAVLDGGFAAWQAEDRPVTTEVPNPRPGDFTGEPGAMPTVDADEAAAYPERGALLDVRAAARYRGETEPVDSRPGHVPGARNSPVSEFTDDHGHWRDPATLAEHFAALGLSLQTPTAVYCGSGVNACAAVLAFEHAGYPRPALYPGSYSQWSADPARPVATGDEPPPTATRR